MKISTKGRYGLRILVELARRYGQGPVMVEVLERSQNISSPYIHQILLALKRTGFVRTVRGPHGGYELSKRPAEITAWDVVVALEGDLDVVECVLHPGTCPRVCSCPTREVWVALREAAYTTLNTFTLEVLAQKNNSLNNTELNYYI